MGLDALPLFLVLHPALKLRFRHSHYVPHGCGEFGEFGIVWRRLHGSIIAHITMNTHFLDFATCPRCRLSIPIRPAMPSTVVVSQRSTEKDGPTLFVACSRCMYVGEIEEGALEPRPSTTGLIPYHEGAPLRVFEIPIECDALNCKTLATVIATRSSDTSGEAVQTESKQWILTDLKCLLGHRFPWPPWH